MEDPLARGKGLARNRSNRLRCLIGRGNRDLSAPCGRQAAGVACEDG